MSSIVIAGDTSGSVTLQAPAVSGSTILTLPATSGTVQTSGGGYTTNGVAFASSTSVLATGSGFTYNGTSAQLGDSLSVADGSRFYVYGNIPASTQLGIKIAGNATTYTQQAIRFYDTYTEQYAGYVGFTPSSLTFGQGTTEGMRLTSTGLGIGTTTIGNKLTVADNSASAMIYAEQSGAGDIIALASGGTEKFRITNAGNVLVGTAAVSSQSEKFNVTATNCAAMFKTTGGSTNNWAANFWNNGTTGNNIFVEFGTETSYTARGTITYNRAGGVLLYNTTSDYRAKDIYGPVTNSGSLIDSVPVYMGKMKGATQERPMFLAHETPAYAHTGEKDAVDKDGNPVYQQMDASALIPVMWAEIQSLRQRLSAANL